MLGASILENLLNHVKTNNNIQKLDVQLTMDIADTDICKCANNDVLES